MNELKQQLVKWLKLSGPEKIDDGLCMQNTRSWDSLTHMDIVIGLEEKFGINLDGDEIIQCTSWPGIVVVLQKHGVSLS